MTVSPAAQYRMLRTLNVTCAKYAIALRKMRCRIRVAKADSRRVKADPALRGRSRRPRLRILHNEYALHDCRGGSLEAQASDGNARTLHGLDNNLEYFLMRGAAFVDELKKKFNIAQDNELADRLSCKPPNISQLRSNDDITPSRAITIMSTLAAYNLLICGKTFHSFAQLWNSFPLIEKTKATHSLI